MTSKPFTFLCFVCGTVNTSSADVAPTTGKPGKKITLSRTCNSCQQVNLLTVPETWDFRPLALGDAIEVVGTNEDGSPMFQGRKE
jgi:hypothetical protein